MISLKNVPPEALDSFREEASNKIKSFLSAGQVDKNMTTEDYLKLGYELALLNSYKKNNGVPPIPFPVSFSTVDMGSWCYFEEEISILLGRKPKQTQFQFPGGFRDPKETSKEAAQRELNEETNLNLLDEKGNPSLDRFEEVCQLFIDDARYKVGPHKVTTTLYSIHLTAEEMSSARPGDDLEEVRIFKLNDLIKDPSIIRDVHLPIFELLWQHILGVPDQSGYITSVHNKKVLQVIDKKQE